MSLIRVVNLELMTESRRWKLLSQTRGYIKHIPHTGGIEGTIEPCPLNVPSLVSGLLVTVPGIRPSTPVRPHQSVAKVLIA